MGKFIDLTGHKFGRLTVLERDFSKKGTYWKCVCECQTIKTVQGKHLKSGHTKSCGCYHQEVRTSHGMCGTPEYNAWENMKRRCYKLENRKYRSYHTRGIKVCDRWLHSFENFYEDMGDRLSVDHSLDRINNDKGYSPDNCRWATREEQQNNMSSNHFLTLLGRNKTMAEWSRILGIPYHIINQRIWRGWSTPQALLTAPGKRRVLK